MSIKKEKVLILCVDRDDDVGNKAGVLTPIVGRANNLDAASKMALIDPEESDANAIFGAVNTYDSLCSELNIKDCEIATITGSTKGRITADKKIKQQLITVLEKFQANNVVLVTDGFSDEQVIPIIQSQVPIMSVKRIVVRHSETIEESWVLLSRYIKKALEDPYYAHWILGAPGLLLLIMAIIWQFVEILNPGVVFLIMIGVLLIIKGFGIDKHIVEFIYPSPPNLVRLFTTVTSLIIGGLAFYQTYGILIENFNSPENWINILPTVIGFALRYSVDLITIAFSIFTLGLSVYLYFLRDPRMLRSIVGLVVGLLMRNISFKVSEILLLDQTPVPSGYLIDLFVIIIFSIIITVCAIYLTLKLGKRLEVFFKQSEIQK